MGRKPLRDTNTVTPQRTVYHLCTSQSLTTYSVYFAYFLQANCIQTESRPSAAMHHPLLPRSSTQCGAITAHRRTHTSPLAHARVSWPLLISYPYLHFSSVLQWKIKSHLSEKPFTALLKSNRLKTRGFRLLLANIKHASYCTHISRVCYDSFDSPFLMMSSISSEIFPL